MKKVFDYIKKYWKAITFGIGLLGSLTVGVLGWHWEETAESPFWYNLWPFLALIGIGLFIGGVIWFSKKKNLKW